MKLWDFRFGKWQATWLVLVLIALSAIAEFFSAGLGSQINPSAFGDFLLMFAAALAGFFLIAQFLGYKHNGRYIIVAVAAMISTTLIASVVELVMSSAIGYSRGNVGDQRIKQLMEWLPFVIFPLHLIWIVAVLTRTIRIAFLATWVKSLTYSVLYFLFLGVVAYALTNQEAVFRSSSSAAYQAQ